MFNQIVAVTRSERGMTTAEYALGTIAVVCIVGVVISFVTGDAFSGEVADTVSQIIDWIQSFIKR